ncbi:hypothetical protein V7S43_014569 [Phytophthora oleae]|uniref:Uncharacterized protein n=1 Tax=Phytophthora oleae TaxID=2107226 RepID=A0ABD3F429_9STRA
MVHLRFLPKSLPFTRLQNCMATAAKHTVAVQRTRLAYADTIGDEHRRGKLLGLGPLLHRLDNFGGAVAEKLVICCGVKVDIKVKLTNNMVR